MSRYRFYFLKNNRIIERSDEMCADDGAAWMVALTLVQNPDGGCDGAEIWAGHRLVGRHARSPSNASA